MVAGSYAGHNKSDDLDPGNLVLRRMSKVGLEVKSLSKIISDTSIKNNSRIYCEFGIPTKEGEYLVDVSMAYK